MLRSRNKSPPITATFTVNAYVITPNAPQNVNYGADQALTITPNTGYHILDVGADGASSVGAVSVYTFNVTANHTITAAFARNTYRLTVATAGNGAGVVTPTVSAHSYHYGAVVTLTATLAITSTFAG